MAQQTADPGSWLEVLAGGYTAGRIPPGGMVWEDPPTERYATRYLMAGAENKTPRGQDGQPRRIAATPVTVRVQIVGHLRTRPGDWARVFDGTWQVAGWLASWYRGRPGGLYESSARACGLTVAVYARWLGTDVIL